MRIIPLPRRHRILWLVVVVLAFSTWGSWLVSTGRTPGYSSGYADIPISASAPVPVSRALGVPDVAELLMTSPSPAPVPTSAAAASPVAAVAGSAGAAPMPAASSGVAASRALVPSPAGLAGMTDSLAFARAVADSVLTYAPGADLEARADAVMAVAALPPVGSPVGLATDVDRFAPDPVLVFGDATVTFRPDSVQPSRWAVAQFDELKVPEGSFAIDVTGSQLITVPGQHPVAVSVTLGITGACPPALSQCEIDRIFPRTVAQELGS